MALQFWMEERHILLLSEIRRQVYSAEHACQWSCPRAFVGQIGVFYDLRFRFQFTSSNSLV